MTSLGKYLWIHEGSSVKFWILLKEEVCLWLRNCLEKIPSGRPRRIQDNIKDGLAFSA
jgi:hypothetical protein